MQCAKQPTQPASGNYGVVVEEQDVLAPCRTDALIGRFREAEVFWVGDQLGMRDRTEVLDCPICGVVIDEDKLKGLSCESLDAFHAEPGVFELIVGNDQNRREAKIFLPSPRLRGEGLGVRGPRPWS